MSNLFYRLGDSNGLRNSPTTPPLFLCWCGGGGLNGAQNVAVGRVVCPVRDLEPSCPYRWSPTSFFRTKLQQGSEERKLATFNLHDALNEDCSDGGSEVLTVEGTTKAISEQASAQ
jgi:hypothetical protein